MNKLNYSQETYLKAYHFAANAHVGQLVPSTNISYLMHLSFVTMEVIAALAHHPEADGDLTVQCALLHDVVEDTAVTSHQVAEKFGTAVSQGVLALTKNDQLPSKEAKMADSLARIQQQPHEVWMVKLADRITNLQAPPAHWSPEKIQAYRQEAIQIYQALRPASDYLAARLHRKIEAYQQYE